MLTEEYCKSIWVVEIKSSAPEAYRQIIKPVCDAVLIDAKVNELLDFYEDSENNDREREKAYSRALNLAKKSNRLMGYTL